MGLNTYPYNPFPASTDKLDEAHNEKIQAEIDQLQNGLTDLDNVVNGDSTVYPYADVITIEDAVPANLADCKVKIEPVQDLHGYDKPWVGGAGKNKFDSALIVNPSQTAQWIQITLKANTQYTVSSNVPYHSTSAYIFAVGGTDTSGATSETDGVGLNTPRTVTTDSNGVLSFAYRTNGGSGIIDLSNYTYQIEEGSTATDYEPYTNICPISGHTESVVTRESGNLFDEQYTGISETTTYKPIFVGDGTFRMSTTCPKNSSNAANLFFFAGSVNTGASTADNGVWVDNPRTVNSVNGYVTVAYRVISGADPRNYVTKVNSVKQYTIALGSTIYGGTVDFDSGVMTVTHKYMKVTDLTRSNNTLFYKTLSDAGVPNNYTVLCDREKTANQWGDVGVFTDQYGAFMLKTAEEYTSAADCLTAYGGELNICYPLATHTTVQLTTQQIQLLKGTNTLTASTGQISVTANGVSGAIGAVQTQANATDAALADIAEQLPAAPTTDGVYVLTVTVASGTPAYSWVSAE